MTKSKSGESDDRFSERFAIAMVACVPIAWVMLIAHPYWIAYWPTPFVAWLQRWSMLVFAAVLAAFLLAVLRKKKVTAAGRPLRVLPLVLAVPLFAWACSRALTGLAATATVLVPGNAFSACVVSRDSVGEWDLTRSRYPIHLDILEYREGYPTPIRLTFRTRLVSIERLAQGDRVRISGRLTPFGGTIDSIARDASCASRESLDSRQ